MIKDKLQAQASKFEEVLDECYTRDGYDKYVWDSDVKAYIKKVKEALNSSKENQSPQNKKEKEVTGEISSGRVAPVEISSVSNKYEDKNPTSLELTNHRSNEEVGVSDFCTICGKEKKEHTYSFSLKTKGKNKGKIAYQHYWCYADKYRVEEFQGVEE